MDKAIGPAARTVRFLLIMPTLTGVILWAARSIEARPWIVLRFLWLDLGGMVSHHEFWFNGRWLVPGWRYFPVSYHYLAASWKASLAVGAALFLAGVGALWIDRLIIRWHRSPVRPLP